jgi:hypothetical protein
VYKKTGKTNNNNKMNTSASSALTQEAYTALQRDRKVSSVPPPAWFPLTWQELFGVDPPKEPITLEDIEGYHERLFPDRKTRLRPNLTVLREHFLREGRLLPDHVHIILYEVRRILRYLLRGVVIVRLTTNPRSHNREREKEKEKEKVTTASLSSLILSHFKKCCCFLSL